MITVLTLLTIQGIMGAFDNLWHHELTEALPSKPSAWRELSLHSARAFIYGIIFLALGWSHWHGSLAVVLAFLLVIEVAITLWDFIEEDMTRKLPPLERVLHTLLAVNYGAVLAFLTPVLWSWAQRETAITYAYYGWLTWIMTVYAIGIFAWSLRDGFSAWRLRPLLVPDWQRNPLSVTDSVLGRTIVVAGATGFIGRQVVRALIEGGDSVIILTRDLTKAAHMFGPHARTVRSLDEIAEDEPIDAVINLAGEPVAGLPWTRGRRAAILDSRIKITDDVLDFIRRLKSPPATLISASAIGYYGDRGNAQLTEEADPGTGFAARLALKWEARARVASAMHVRTVLMRFGIVLGRTGGAFPQLAGPVRYALGAVMGSGRQWTSWIHIDDAVQLILHALDTPGLTGAVNAVAPHPATSADMMGAIANVLHRPLFIRIPEAVLRSCLGEMACLFLDSAKVQPVAAQTVGFQFRFPHIQDAVTDLVQQHKSGVLHGASSALKAWTTGHG